MRRKHYYRLVLIPIILAALTVTNTVNLHPRPSETERIRAIIITGGHDFDRPAFFAMFDGFENITYAEVQHPDANDLYGSERASQPDVFIFYDMYDTITPRQQAEFIELLKQGTGMVFLHHSLASYQDWQEFLHIVGGRYHLEPYTEDGNRIAASTYRHDVDIPVEIQDKAHPITRGLEDFVIHDEVYGNCRILPGVHPLLETDHPESLPYLAWTNDYENSRIVYIQPGHDAHAYGNPNYQRLLQQAIFWAANR